MLYYKNYWKDKMIVQNLLKECLKIDSKINSKKDLLFIYLRQKIKKKMIIMISVDSKEILNI